MVDLKQQKSKTVNKGGLLYCHQEHSMSPPGTAEDHKPLYHPEKCNILADTKSRPLVYQFSSHTHSYPRVVFDFSLIASMKDKIIDNYSYGKKNN